MRGDRGREVFLGFTDIGDGLFRGDVFEHDAQFGQPAGTAVRGLLDEHGLASKTSISGSSLRHERATGMPISAIRSSTGMTLSIEVTPCAELVVACAG